MIPEKSNPPLDDVADAVVPADEHTAVREAASDPQSDDVAVDWQQTVQALEQKAADNWDKALRALSDLENTRRRAQRDVEQAHKFGTEKLVEALLPIIDSLEQALEAMTAQSSESAEALKTGVELTYKMFIDTLTKFSVEVLDPLDQKFDPVCHEAMSVQVVEEKPAGVVLSVLQKGYRLHERVIRAARVIVSQQAPADG